MEEGAYRHAYQRLFSAVTDQLDALAAIREAGAADPPAALLLAERALRGALAQAQVTFSDMLEAGMFSPSCLSEKIRRLGGREAEAGGALLRKLLEAYWLSGDGVYMGLDRFVHTQLLAMPHQAAIHASEQLWRYISTLLVCQPDPEARNMLEQLGWSISLSIAHSNYYALRYAVDPDPEAPVRYYVNGFQPGHCAGHASLGRSRRPTVFVTSAACRGNIGWII